MDIAVIIPFYNESKTIVKTLDSLSKQTMQAAEIFMVDSGSNDDSIEKIRSWTKKNSFNNRLKILFSDKSNPSTSINKGIESSKSPLIAYIDCGLKIPNTWLEEQYLFLKSTNSDIVSLCVYTDGKTNTDISFIAQTYGYKNQTPCLPGSIIKRELFNELGPLIDDSRAGYDIDLINKIKNSTFKRTVNHNISIKYFGINYSDSFLSGAKKVFSYSLSGWQTVGDQKPKIYILLSILSFFLFQQGYFFTLLISYLIVRGVFVPILKSKSLEILSKSYLFPYIFLSGLTIDVSRVLAYIYSLPKLLP